MKKFLLCMSCFLLLMFSACAGSADNGIGPEAEKEIKIETIDDADDSQPLYGAGYGPGNLRRNM